jgi:hypothetical protein
MSESKHPASNEEFKHVQSDTSSDRYLAWSSQAPNKDDERYAPVVDKRDRFVYPLMIGGLVLTVTTGIGALMHYGGQIKAGINDRLNEQFGFVSPEEKFRAPIPDEAPYLTLNEYRLICGPSATDELDGLVQQVVEQFCNGVNDRSPASIAFNAPTPLEEQSSQGVS